MIKLLFILLLTITFNNAVAYTILIDPGHGGKDLGAVRSFNRSSVNEKDIALNISKEIYRLLRKKYNVFLTRSFDKEISLAKRSAIAEKVQADIFVSIHLNASMNPRSHGYETFYLDNHDNVAIKKIEDTENKNLSGEALLINQILTDLVIQNTVHSSKNLARYIHSSVGGHIKKQYKMRNRGIKPGLFYVLALSKRPSVLLEAGFLSNKRELKKLKSKSFQRKYARAVARGIDQYFKSLNSGSVNLL